MKQAPVNIKNKRATFDYETDGHLYGWHCAYGHRNQVHPVGGSKLSRYVLLLCQRRIVVKNMHVAEYFYGSYNNHNARRERKLLLNKKELEKLMRGTKDPGFTIVPVRLFINEKGLAKLVVALAKGKKQYDKRESLKEKDDKRDMARMFKR